jgi:hypothetical protein
MSASSAEVISSFRAGIFASLTLFCPMLLAAIGHEKTAGCPLNPVIPVQYSSEARRSRGAPAFDPGGRTKLLN